MNQNHELIKLNDVSFSYEQTPVLSGVSLTVNNGDFVGIIGKNGSGKTTLLKIILGQLKPQRGNVEITRETTIGYVEQVTPSSDFAFPANVQEMVMLGLYGKIGKFKFANTKHKIMVKNALHMVGLEGLEHKQFSHLSGGQQQRVIIAKALVSSPTLLILDEPTTGIDSQSEQDFFSLLHHLNKGHGKTIIMVTHNFDKLKAANVIYKVVDSKVVKEVANV